MSVAGSFSDGAVVPLWQGAAPGQRGGEAEDIPTLTVFPAGGTGGQPTPALLIFPGGGYEMLAFEHEGVNEARWFQARGVSAFVLKYRLPIHGYRHPVPLLDAQRAVRLVRSRAGEWGIDAGRVGIMGFSAGGHLAATLETHYDFGDPHAADAADRPGCRPDVAVLVYPVISLQDGMAHPGSKRNLLGPEPDPALVENLSNERQVTAQTPPTLLVHSEDDTVVSIENSRLHHAALRKAGVVSELHAYPAGGHGYGFGLTPDRSPAGWLERAGEWLKAQGFGG